MRLSAPGSRAGSPTGSLGSRPAAVQEGTSGGRETAPSAVLPASVQLPENLVSQIKMLEMSFV